MSTGVGEVRELRERLARFTDAALRINESLDLDVVLQGVLDSARELTGGRYALLSLVDSSGELQECLTSGMTDKESEGFLREMPDRWELYDFLIGFEETVRVDDFQAYLDTYELPQFAPPFAVSTPMALLAVPVFHSGERSGVIYVAEKPPSFTAQDEETLAVFASLAAVVISNARRFEGERRARADLEALVGTAPMSVMVFDAVSGTVTSVNREARRLLGDLEVSAGSVEELMEAATIRLPGDQDAVADSDMFKRMLESGEPVRDLEVTVEFEDGRGVALMVNATPIVGADDEVESVVVAAQDLTPLAEMERLRTEFLGMIGHELRSPLAAIKGSAATLVQEASSLDEAEMIQFLRIIDGQADKMRELLGDLIDMVRIESGTLAMNPAPTPLSLMVEEARDTFAGMGGRENIVIEVADDLPQVMADRKRVSQVFTNLLINATRHSHEGSAIRIEAARDGVYVAVSVIDSGQGLPAERIPHLFAKFYRPEGVSESRDLGLGLAICKGIVEAHGGRIWAQSDGLGLGSRFTFTLPISDTAPRGAAAQSRDAHEHTGAIRVLAIDDDPRALKRVRDSLVDEGYEPTVTGDPSRIGALIAQVDPHVVLLDLMLPDTDGIELMRQILAICHAPVIFLSAYSQTDLVANALEAGAADYIIKPFSPTELAARIRAALRGRTLPAAASPAPERPSDRSSQNQFELGELSIDYSAQLVSVAGRTVDLAPVEYRLLTALAANAGTLVPHQQLIAAVWGPGTAADAHRLRTVIKNLRQKLGDDARNPRYIFTGARVGYRMPRPDPA